jgi:uncharacterized membrane protein
MSYLLLATLFGGATFIFAKIIATKLHPVLGNAITMFTALTLQIAVLTYLKTKGVNLFVAPQGIFFAIFGGIAVGLYTMFLFLALSQFNITKAIPVIYIGSIILALLFGIIFLKEPFGWLNFIGVFFALIGITLMFWK